MMKKWHALLPVVLLFWMTAARAETTLEVAVFPALDQIISAALPAWDAAHPDVKIRVVTRNYQDHHNAALAALIDGEDRIDVMAVEIDRLRQFANSDGLENLAKLPYKGLLYRRKFVDYTFPLAASNRGELIAIPADVAPVTMFYRKDILDKSEVTEAELTRSWEGFVESGKKIKAATGVYLTSRAAEVANIILHSNLKDGEGLYFDKDNRLLVESPRFVRAFEIARAVREAKLDANSRIWSAEWTKNLQRGVLATQFNGSWFGGVLANTVPKSAGMWRVTDLPAGAFAYHGGAYYGVSKYSKNKQLAWEFVKFMTLDKGTQLKAFKQQNAFPALLEAQVDPFLEEPVEFFGGQKVRILWRDAARRIPSIRVNEHDNIAHDIVEAELEKVLENGKDISAALKDAKAAIEKTLAPEAHRAE